MTRVSPVSCNASTASPSHPHDLPDDEAGAAETASALLAAGAADAVAGPHGRDVLRHQQGLIYGARLPHSLNSNENIVPSSRCVKASSSTLEPLRTRTVFTETQTQYLKSVFDETHYPDTFKLDEMAKTLNLDESVVRRWFEYRRRRQKLVSPEGQEKKISRSKKPKLGNKPNMQPGLGAGIALDVPGALGYRTETNNTTYPWPFNPAALAPNIALPWLMGGPPTYPYSSPVQPLPTNVGMQPNTYNGQEGGGSLRNYISSMNHATLPLEPHPWWETLPQFFPHPPTYDPLHTLPSFHTSHENNVNDPETADVVRVHPTNSQSTSYSPGSLITSLIADNEPRHGWFVPPNHYPYEVPENVAHNLGEATQPESLMNNYLQF